MKKVKYLLLLCMSVFLLTGCVKFNANMDIKKDKSMDFSIIYAFDQSLLGDQQLLDDEDKKELEDQGFKITDYSQDKMKGFTLSRSIRNIDMVSSTSDMEYSLSGMLDDKSENKYLFKVKKGILKNTYVAKFKFDAADSDLNDSTDKSSSSSSSSLGGDDSSSDSDFNFSSASSNMLYSSMMANMDLSFNVTLPYSAKSNNATTTNNDNKKLSWNLSSNQAETIDFEFELYNMTNIYIGIGVIVVVIISVAFIFVSKRKKNSNNNNISNNFYQDDNSFNQPVQPQPTMNYDNQSNMQFDQNMGQNFQPFQPVEPGSQNVNFNQGMQMQQGVNQVQNNQNLGQNSQFQQSELNNQVVQQDNNFFNE